ncbi:MAG: hypothetical protein SFW07_03225 [Gammaproteobacteria bacterium]|nr:hypothetical protein [Gammaproteobacteria bacterium]
MQDQEFRRQVTELLRKEIEPFLEKNAGNKFSGRFMDEPERSAAFSTIGVAFPLLSGQGVSPIEDRDVFILNCANLLSGAIAFDKTFLTPIGRSGLPEKIRSIFSTKLLEVDSYRVEALVAINLYVNQKGNKISENHAEALKELILNLKIDPQKIYEQLRKAMIVALEFIDDEGEEKTSELPKNEKELLATLEGLHKKSFSLVPRKFVTETIDSTPKSDSAIPTFERSSVSTPPASRRKNNSSDAIVEISPVRPGVETGGALPDVVRTRTTTPKKGRKKKDKKPRDQVVALESVTSSPLSTPMADAVSSDKEGLQVKQAEQERERKAEEEAQARLEREREHERLVEEEKARKREEENENKRREKEREEREKAEREKAEKEREEAERQKKIREEKDRAVEERRAAAYLASEQQKLRKKQLEDEKAQNEKRISTISAEIKDIDAGLERKSQELGGVNNAMSQVKTNFQQQISAEVKRKHEILVPFKLFFKGRLKDIEIAGEDYVEVATKSVDAVSKLRATNEILDKLVNRGIYSFKWLRENWLQSAYFQKRDKYRIYLDSRVFAQQITQKLDGLSDDSVDGVKDLLGSISKEILAQFVGGVQETLKKNQDARVRITGEISALEEIKRGLSAESERLSLRVAVLSAQLNPGPQQQMGEALEEMPRQPLVK